MTSAGSTTQDCVLRDFGKRLRYLRQARKLRQLDVEALGLSYKYYQRLEAGRVNPTLLTLHKLATAFEVSVHELFCPRQETLQGARETPWRMAPPRPGQDVMP